MIRALILDDAGAHFVLDGEGIGQVGDAERQVDGISLYLKLPIRNLDAFHAQRGYDIFIVTDEIFLGNFAVALGPKTAVRLFEIQGGNGGGIGGGDVLRSPPERAGWQRQAEQQDTQKKNQISGRKTGVRNEREGNGTK